MDLILLPLFFGYLLIMLAVVQIKKDNSLGNFTWGGGVMLIGLYSFFVYSLQLPRQIVATALVMIWGLRLSVYVYSRYKKGVDPRFESWKQHWGAYALPISIAWIFGANGGMAMIMSIPILLINTSATVPSLGLLDYGAIILWLVGFYFESVSDYQLYEFRKNPINKDKVLDTGLWRYSRHPNYFGEIVMWWALFLLALPVPNGWYAIISALIITINLRFISGVPVLEKAMEQNALYREYQRRTSILFPWFAKK
jgi:steroid 5-alpha reductase family enzyme